MTDRALVVRGPGLVSLEDREPAAPGPGDVVVRPSAVGMCGTDLEIIGGVVDPAFVRYPVVIGHEWSGTVVSEGDGGPASGTPVVVEGIVPCWKCVRCHEGRSNLCLAYEEIGFTRDGAASDRVVVPSRQVHALAPSIHPEAAALVEPSAVAYRALRRARLDPGRRALVVGDGTVAMLIAYLLHLWSPAEVVMLGRRPEQRALAEEAGVSRFETDAFLAGEDFDLVVEAAGTPEAAVTGLGCARRGGTVVLVGLAGHGRTAAMPVDEIVTRDLTILGSFSYTSSAWGEVVVLLNAGRLKPRFLVTHRFSLEAWEDAIETLRGAEGPRGKVLLTISDGWGTGSPQ